MLSKSPRDALCILHHCSSVHSCFLLVVSHSLEHQCLTKKTSLLCPAAPLSCTMIIMCISAVWLSEGVCFTANALLWLLHRKLADVITGSVPSGLIQVTTWTIFLMWKLHYHCYILACSQFSFLLGWGEGKHSTFIQQVAKYICKMKVDFRTWFSFHVKVDISEERKTYSIRQISLRNFYGCTVAQR